MPARVCSKMHIHELNSRRGIVEVVGKYVFWCILTILIEFRITETTYLYHKIVYFMSLEFLQIWKSLLTMDTSQGQEIFSC